MLFGLVPIVLCIVLFRMLRREFMPKLEEGNFWIRVSFPTSISLDESAKYGEFEAHVCRGCGFAELYVKVAATIDLRKVEGAILLHAELPPPYR